MCLRKKKARKKPKTLIGWTTSLCKTIEMKWSLSVFVVMPILPNDQTSHNMYRIMHKRQ